MSEEEKPKFAYIPLDVIQDRRLTLIQTRVLIAIFSIRYKDTNLRPVKRSELSFRTGYTIQNISRVTTELEELGWLKKNGLGGRSTPCQYEITVPDLNTVSGPDTVSDLNTKTVSGPDTKTVSDPDTGILKDNRKDIKKTISSAFDAFWMHYPLKKNKKKAQETWKRKKLDRLADRILEDLKVRPTKDRAWIEGYVPLPTTYLNGERWEDEMDEGTKKAGGSRASHPGDLREFA